MGTELPKDQDSSGDTDSNTESENSSSTETSGSDWECSGNKQSTVQKPHFSVTSCDTGLKLKIAAIPPRKVSTKKSPKPTVKKKPIQQNITKSNKEKSTIKKKSKLSDTTSTSDSCSKCSSDSSSDDDLPLKALAPKVTAQKSPQKNIKSKQITKSDSDENKLCEDSKDNILAPKDKSVPKTNCTVVKKSDESNQNTTMKKRRGRPRAKVLSFVTSLAGPRRKNSAGLNWPAYAETGSNFRT